METAPTRPQDLNSGLILGDLPVFTTTSKTFGQEAYQGVLEDEAVEPFLRESEEYDTSNNRWIFPEGAKGLLHGMYDALRSIVSHFVVPSAPGVERAVLSSESTPGCDVDNRDGYRICPILVVRAAGPSFEVPIFDEDVGAPPSVDPSTAAGFSNMATYFVVRAEGETGSEEDILREMGSYARHIFREQPNRFYVRSLFITEQRAWLAHIDRAGGQITPPIDIHGDSRAFVKIVCGISSTNERLLGIDDSIQWTDINGRKAGGSLTTTDPSGEPRRYNILELITPPSGSILGRATTCWRVQDPETLEEYVVKDAWRPDIMAPEYELLELVKGIPGVVQMVSYETGRGEVKEFRCPTTSGQFHNRIASRTTLKAYGKSIVSFTSALQALSALRDAIAGHQRLGGDGIRILHRDISHNNVLLGEEGAPVGERGILIDLDLAFRVTDDEPTVRTNHEIGTRLFQSISVLASARLKEKTFSHDHIDELESFFYLLAYVLLLFKPDGSPVSSKEEGPPIVWAWGAEEAEEAEINKKQFRRFGPPAMRSNRLIRASWGPACGVLFQSFLLWIMKRTEDKTAIFHGYECREYLRGGPSPFEVFYSLRDEHYATVLGMFDQAINEIKASTPPTDKDASEVTTTLPEPLVANGADTETHKPTTHVGVVSSAPPTPPTIPAPLRRSTRIQEIRLQASRRCVVPSANASPLTKNIASTPLAPAGAEPRRSARIQKRRLDEEDHVEVPQPKVRRTKTGPRRAARSR